MSGDPVPDVPLLAGMGGVNSSESQSVHFGRKAIILSRENNTKERALQLVTLDPHGPNELRANGPLSNISEFHEAFDITDGDKMYKPVEERVDIW